jgi:ubiquinone/menaquinone biosynthesis C-methylase UbiE
MEASTTRRLFARFMRVFFYLLYHPMAWSYDLVAAMVSWGRWQDWVMSVIPYLEGPRVLELGHGPGHLQIALQKNGVLSFGVDASRQMGQQAKLRILKQGQTFRLICGYAQCLSFSAETFDQIVATFPTEYIYVPETLAEIYRTLKPGGKLIVLPAAWITGRGLVDRGTATLFRVTGQAPTWDPQWLEPFIHAGFQTKAKLIHQKSWSLVIILAKKPN